MFTIAIDQGIGLRKLFGTVHPYPSHAEIVRQAADEFARVTYPSFPGLGRHARAAAGAGAAAERVR